MYSVNLHDFLKFELITMKTYFHLPIQNWLFFKIDHGREDFFPGVYSEISQQE